ncbi:MAG TPA: M23 family metallopeptidase [Candidatus Methylomirabilis sp.]
MGQGQQIAESGSTGNSTGDHLHFGIRLEGGGWVDPVNFLP